jgi:RHS repeat-associated protein
VGNVTQRTDDQGTASFTYDDLDRLTAADYPGTDDYAYAYDPAGNLTSISTPAGTTTHTYDAADRLSDTGYLYDANGNLLSDGTRSFTYDALGRLTGVTGPSLSASYTLDGDGNRTSETIDGVSTDFDLDLRGLPTVLVAGDKSYLPGMPNLGYAQSGSWLSSLTDAQGSVLQTIDAQGVTSPLTRYDPYGNPRPGSSVASGIGYGGEWTDPTGLVNLRFRAYDPSLGRFLSRDTFDGLPAIPLTGNRHSDALGNPLRYTDPSGHFVNGVLIPGGQGVADSVWGFGEGFVNLGAGTASWALDSALATPGALVDWANNPRQNLANSLFRLGEAAGGVRGAVAWHEQLQLRRPRPTDQRVGGKSLIWTRYPSSRGFQAAARRRNRGSPPRLPRMSAATATTAPRPDSAGRCRQIRLRSARPSDLRAPLSAPGSRQPPRRAAPSRPAMRRS